MPKCSCAGSTCGCSVQAGSGTTVRGTGIASDPYRVDVDPSALALNSIIRTVDSSTIDFSVTGTGGANDPLLISGSVRLFSPDNSAWRPVVANDGTLTAVRV